MLRKTINYFFRLLVRVIYSHGEKCYDLFIIENSCVEGEKKEMIHCDCRVLIRVIQEYHLPTKKNRTTMMKKQLN